MSRQSLFLENHKQNVWWREFQTSNKEEEEKKRTRPRVIGMSIPFPIKRQINTQSYAISKSQQIEPFASHAIETEGHFIASKTVVHACIFTAEWFALTSVKYRTR